MPNIAVYRVMGGSIAHPEYQWYIRAHQIAHPIQTLEFPAKIWVDFFWSTIDLNLAEVAMRPYKLISGR
jgi:hypothetical protein